MSKGRDEKHEVGTRIQKEEMKMKKEDKMMSELDFLRVAVIKNHRA